MIPVPSFTSVVRFVMVILVLFSLALFGEYVEQQIYSTWPLEGNVDDMCKNAYEKTLTPERCSPKLPPMPVSVVQTEPESLEQLEQETAQQEQKAIQETTALADGVIVETYIPTIPEYIAEESQKWTVITPNEEEFVIETPAAIIEESELPSEPIVNVVPIIEENLDTASVEAYVRQEKVSITPENDEQIGSSLTQSRYALDEVTAFATVREIQTEEPLPKNDELIGSEVIQSKHLLDDVLTAFHLKNIETPQPAPIPDKQIGSTESLSKYLLDEVAVEKHVSWIPTEYDLPPPDEYIGSTLPVSRYLLDNVSAKSHVAKITPPATSKGKNLAGYPYDPTTRYSRRDRIGSKVDKKPLRTQVAGTRVESPLDHVTARAVVTAPKTRRAKEEQAGYLAAEWNAKNESYPQEHLGGKAEALTMAAANAGTQYQEDVLATAYVKVNVKDIPDERITETGFTQAERPIEVLEKQIGARANSGDKTGIIIPVSAGTSQDKTWNIDDVVVKRDVKKSWLAPSDSIKEEVMATPVKPRSLLSQTEEDLQKLEIKAAPTETPSSLLQTETPVESLLKSPNTPATPIISPTTPAIPVTPAPTPTPLPVEIPLQTTPLVPTPPPPTTVPTPAPVVPPVQIPLQPTPAATLLSPETQQSASTTQNKGFLINFNNVSVIEYLRFVSKITGKNFIFDEAELQFNVTIVSEEPTSLENIMAALLQELRIHNLSLIEQGNNLIIHSSSKVNAPGKVVVQGQKESPPLADLQTFVFTLTSAHPTKLAELLRPLLSTQALVEPVDETNNLVVTDFKANIDKIAPLIKSLDSSTGGLDVGQYLVKNTTPESLIALAEKIMSPIAQGKTLVFVPHGPTNSIYIVAAPLLLKQTVAMMENLDLSEGKTRVLSLQEAELQKTADEAAAAQAEEQRRLQGFSPEDGLSPETLSRGPKWTSELPLGHVQSTQFFIYKLQFRRGDQIEYALRRIADSLMQTGVANLDLVVTINSIQWIESSNSLVFTGTRESLLKVRELVAELDTPLKQVFIEVLVLDTTMDESLQYGVDWGARFGTPTAAGGEAFLTPNSVLASALDGAGLNGPITLDPSPLNRIVGYTAGVVGRHITHGGLNFNSIGALVRAVHTDTKTNIVMNPKIIVEDNVPAEIFVGETDQFKSQSIVNDQGTIVTNNFEYRDVGSTLRVTPFLGDNDIITLEIEQEVSTTVNGGLSSITGSGGSGVITNPNVNVIPVIKKTHTTTRVHVPDGFFVIISGMIQDQTVRSLSKVPCLGGIPVLGAAFSDKRLLDTKRNLMIFIRPQLVKTEDDFDRITKRQQDIYREKNRTKNSWKFEVDEALDFLNLQSTDYDEKDCP